ncbi:MAG: hypothetical protein GY750_12775 [Lentisphaerae bacterium]|nr:hypothetical protein [Lentisphaerota bacterium]MCP4102287.1 hypothetical protein [Lentisphaerota bacterium]
MMDYTKVQFIGLRFYTGRKPMQNKFKGEYTGFKSCYQDIQGRCDILKETIKRASTSQNIDHNPRTLKVFMAPEFFFRNKDGAYPIEAVHNIMELMRTYTTSNPHYRDWLFIMGTAIGHLEHVDGNEIFNIALIQKGGTKSAEQPDSLIVYKEYISHVDYLRDKTAYPAFSDPKNRVGLIGDVTSNEKRLFPTEGSSDILSKYSNPTGSGLERSKSGLGGQGIFTIGGITFGLEVCLDHAYERLRQSPWLPTENKIQVQLVCSAGMSITESSLACCHKGLIFNVDGNVADARLNRNTGSFMHPKLEHSSYPNPLSQETNLAVPMLPQSFVQKYSAIPSLAIKVFDSIDVPQNTVV